MKTGYQSLAIMAASFVSIVGIALPDAYSITVSGSSSSGGSLPDNVSPPILSLPPPPQCPYKYMIHEYSTPEVNPTCFCFFAGISDLATGKSMVFDPPACFGTNCSISPFSSCIAAYSAIKEIVDKLATNNNCPLPTDMSGGCPLNASPPSPYYYRQCAFDQSC